MAKVQSSKLFSVALKPAWMQHWSVRLDARTLLARCSK